MRQSIGVRCWGLVAVFAVLLVAPAGAGERPNVLLVCVDDLRPELNCFGALSIESPHIDGLAGRGVRFVSHYVQAPTCGASRYALLTGRYGPDGNDALFRRAAAMKAGVDVPPSLPATFRAAGYATVSIGKVSHHPGGRGGGRWNDPSKPEMPDSWSRTILEAGAWRDPRGWMHGLAHGEIRDDRKLPGGGIEMDLLQAADGPDDIYPDGTTIAAATAQIERLASDAQPFFLAVGLLRPHLPFGVPASYVERYANVTLPPIPHPEKPRHRSTWHGSGEFMKYDRGGRDPRRDAAYADEVRRHYAACVTYADAQVGKLLAALDASGRADDTIIVLWGDHGWHLGEHAIWGKHSLFEASLRSPLIIAAPDATCGGRAVEKVVETIDVFPTLCEMAGLPVPNHVHGQSLRPLCGSEAAEPKPGHAVSYHRGNITIRTDRDRLIRHRDGYVELYDMRSPAGETINIAAEHPDRVAELTDLLNRRLAHRDESLFSAD